MGSPGTLPHRLDGIPLRSVRVEVTKGPDAGRSFLSKSDLVTVGTAAGNEVQLSDPTVSRFHLELQRKGDRLSVEDLGSTNGTVVCEALLDHENLWARAGSMLRLGQTELRVDDGELVLVDFAKTDALGEIRGRSETMRRLMALVERAAGSDEAVLLCGESGTGKELVARALHEGGRRGKNPFVVVDCGALTPSLLTSELFGHERGAFTGAEKRYVGAFERAHGGTVFLDEIGELPREAQAAMLGALERKSLRRVGGTEDVPIDARVISATNRNLRAAVNASTFRLDLFYRIAVINLRTPPLRDRPEDVPMFVEHFWSLAGGEGPAATLFTPEVVRRLQQYTWPGNVRELRNVVFSAVALGEVPTPGETVLPEPQPAMAPGPEVAAGLSYREARAAIVNAFEASYLKDLLGRTKGNLRQAAREARMDRSYLMELVKRHRLG